MSDRACGHVQSIIENSDIVIAAPIFLHTKRKGWSLIPSIGAKDTRPNTGIGPI